VDHDQGEERLGVDAALGLEFPGAEQVPPGEEHAGGDGGDEGQGQDDPDVPQAQAAPFTPASGHGESHDQQDSPALVAGCGPVPHEVVDTTTGAADPGGVLTVFLDLPDDAAAVPEDAVKDAVEDLDVDRIDGFGTIPQPNADLAHQLEDLVTTDH
jgi:hypothetical protein